MRVPTDVTVWLGVLSVAITIVYTIIKARAKAFLSFPGTGTDRSAITRESQLLQVDKALIRRWMQEKILEQCEQKLCRIRFVRRRFPFQQKRLFLLSCRAWQEASWAGGSDCEDLVYPHPTIDGKSHRKYRCREYLRPEIRSESHKDDSV